jgi:hypothetical protein
VPYLCSGLRWDAHRGSELLEELEASLAELEQIAQRTATAGVDHGSDLAVLELAETAGDVVAIGHLFVSAQRAAAAATSKTAEMLADVSPDAERLILDHDDWPELDELRVLWKAWFFFVRALRQQLSGTSGEGRSASVILCDSDNRIGVGGP